MTNKPKILMVRWMSCKDKVWVDFRNIAKRKHLPVGILLRQVLEGYIKVQNIYDHG